MPRLAPLTNATLFIGNSFWESEQSISELDSITTSTSKPWAAAQTRLKVKVVGAGPHRLGGPRASPRDPRAINTSSCAGHNGRVSVTTVIAANSAAARYSHFG